MFIDNENKYSDAQALTTTAASTNLIDHGVASELGVGKPLALVIVLTVAADATDTDETYVAQLQMDDNASFSSATSVGEAITITRGTVAGTKYVRAIPNGSVERYTRVNYTLGGTTPSVTLDAFIQPLDMIQNEGVYPGGFTVA